MASGVRLSGDHSSGMDGGVGPNEVVVSIERCGEALGNCHDKKFGDIPKQIRKGKEELERLQVVYQFIEVV